jgi:hypothetical protein
MIIQTVAIQFKCDRCGYTWRPRGKVVPRVCSKCKSRDWNAAEREPVPLPIPAGLPAGPARASKQPPQEPASYPEGQAEPEHTF